MPARIHVNLRLHVGECIDTLRSKPPTERPELAEAEAQVEGMLKEMHRLSHEVYEQSQAGTGGRGSRNREMVISSVSQP